MPLLVFMLFLYQVLRVFACETMGHEIDPDHPGKCVTEGLILSPGETGQPKGICMSILCYDASGLTITQGCPLVENLDSLCTLGDYININAPYPECCQRNIKCPDKN